SAVGRVAADRPTIPTALIAIRAAPALVRARPRRQTLPQFRSAARPMAALFVRPMPMAWLESSQRLDSPVARASFPSLILRTLSARTDGRWQTRQLRSVRSSAELVTPAV